MTSGACLCGGIRYRVSGKLGPATQYPEGLPPDALAPRAGSPS